MSMDGRYTSPYAYLQVNLQEHPTPMEFPHPFSIEEFNFYHQHYPPHLDYEKNALYNYPTTQANGSITEGTTKGVSKPSEPSAAHSNSSNSNSTSKDSRNREKDKSGKERPPKVSRTVNPEEVEKKMTTKALVRARHTLQQRIKRQNETPEQKALRRARNAELNRRRRQNKEDIRVAMEKVKNRLRQRVKREIDRMLRTRQKREDFLRETFEQMSSVFSDADMMQYQGRIANALQEISN